MKINTLLLTGILSLVISMEIVGQEEKSKKAIIDSLTYETQEGLPIAASKIYFSDSKFTISGFGESNFINHQGLVNRNSEDLELYMTNMQRFVAYAAYRPKKWLVLYAEIFAEYFADGDREAEFEFQPELFADFLLSSHFNLRAGTMQLKLGYINNNDEPIMFYSVNRPEVERLIIPSTWIDLGLMAYGKLNKHLKWTASIYQGLDPTQLNEATYIRRGRSDALRMNFNGYTFNPGLSYTGIKNTEMAVNGIHSVMTHNDNRASISLASSYVRYSPKNWSVMLLGATGQTQNAENLFAITQNAETFSSGQVLGNLVYGYYAELGYNILSLLTKTGVQKNEGNLFYRPNETKLPVFIRYERLNTHASVAPELSTKSFNQNDLTAITIGANFNPRRNIVIKANYQFRNNRAPIGLDQFEGNRLELGLGFIF